MVRRRQALALSTALAALALIGSAQAEPIQRGDVRVSFAASFTPRSLPRSRRVPVTIDLRSRVATTDGTQPPPLRRLRIALNRHGRISAGGLPSCSAGELQSTSAGVALARCRPALVGHGSFSGIAAGSGAAPVPLHGTVLAFNASRRGREMILLDLYGTLPIEQAIVVPLRVSHLPGRELGTVLSAKVP